MENSVLEPLCALASPRLKRLVRHSLRTPRQRAILCPQGVHHMRVERFKAKGVFQYRTGLSSMALFFDGKATVTCCVLDDDFGGCHVTLDGTNLQNYLPP